MRRRDDISNFRAVKMLRAVPLVFFSLALATSTRADKPFLGPIPVQYVEGGKDLILDMHRIFHAAGATLQIGPHPGLDVAFDAASFQLRVHSTRPGLSNLLLSTKAGEQSGQTILTVANSGGARHGHHFVFKPNTELANAAAHKVFVAGTFNGWSTEKTPATGPNEQGEYTSDVPLEPGKYQYKYIVDGKWMLDPANPDTADNGLGDKNSVVTVVGRHDTESPVIYADSLEPSELFIRGAAGSPLSSVSAVIEAVPNVALLPAKITGNAIVVTLPTNADGFVRVIGASPDGTPTNVVRCAVGPTAKKFSWHDAVLYYALTDRFADGDKANDKPVDNPKVEPPANFHGGDLAGIRKKIDEGYFDRLGVNAIWVAPLNKNPTIAYQESPEPHRWYTGYHGYWPVSSTELDPHMGSTADLEALVQSAHSHKMKVIADLVLHHVHVEHPWWKEHRDWFGSLELPDGRKNLRLWDEQQFTTWFEPYLPSFDFSKAEPVRALIDNSVWWLDHFKLDGFRLDAVKHIVPSFWWKFRAALRERVDEKRKAPLYLVGETFKDRAGIMSFVGPNMLDGQFDFPLYDQIKDTFGLTTGDMKTLDEALTASEKTYGKETLMSPLVGNHDKGRFMAYADGDLPAAEGVKEEEVGWKNPPRVDNPDSYAKLELAQAFLMSVDGVPMIYYGDEIGMTGAGDPDNRRDMRFGEQVGPDEKRVLENFERLGAIRRAHPALRYGSRRTLRADQNVYAFLRAHLADRILVALNRGKDEATEDFDVSPEFADGEYVDALSGKKLRVENGKLQVPLSPQSVAFISRALP
ncbi:MAG: alpha-amylase family glycosyl hydrolase [Chthoniobacterales bacterium]